MQISVWGYVRGNLMGISKILIYIFIVAGLFLNGCTTLPLTVFPGSSLSSSTLTSIAIPPVYATHEKRGDIALGDSGVHIFSLKDGQRTLIDPRHPAFLAWSPQGDRIAALFYDQSGNARIEIFTRNGTRTATTQLREKAIAILWKSEQELLVFANTYTSHRFGTSLQQKLIHLKDDGTITHKQSLHETTILPNTVKSIGLEQLQGVIPPRLSPDRDEIIYTKLFNPPVFTPYLMLTARNLSSSAEYAIAKVELKARDAMFANDGETAYWTEDDGRAWQRKLWSAEPAQTVVHSATPEIKIIQHPPLLAGTIYHEGQRKVTLPDDAVIHKLNDNRYVAAWQGTLYILHGDWAVRTGETPLNPAQREKLATIRAWRSSGLITGDEYSAAKQRILKP